MKTVWLEDMSYPEIAEAMKNGADTVLICAASNEIGRAHV